MEKLQNFLTFIIILAKILNRRFFTVFNVLLEQIFPRPLEFSDGHYLQKISPLVIKNRLSLLKYKDPTVRKLIHYLKFHRDTLLIQELSESMYHTFITTDYYQSVLNSGRKLLIVTMPSSDASFRKKGFHHGFDIAKKIAFKLKAECLSPKFIQRQTSQKQAFLNKQERLRNIYQKFSITHTKNIHGSICIIVDDVWTTGASIEALSYALTEACAHEVYAITLAH